MKYLSGRSRGIVMVEVLFVMLVISVGLTVVVRAMVQAAKGSAFAAEHVRAASAINGMAVRSLITLAGGGTLTGSDGACPGWDGQIKCMVMPGPETSADTLRAVDLRVAWGNGKKEPMQEVTLLVIPAGGVMP